MSYVGWSVVLGVWIISCKSRLAARLIVDFAQFSVDLFSGSPPFKTLQKLFLVAELR